LFHSAKAEALVRGSFLKKAPPNPRKNFNGCLSAGPGVKSINTIVLVAIKVFGKVWKPFFQKGFPQGFPGFADQTK
jgi:hypothetical protein